MPATVIPVPTVQEGRSGRRIVMRYEVVDDTGRVRVNCRTEADAVEFARMIGGQ